MSKYTTELRYIIENYNDNTTSDNSDVDDMIVKALPKLFNFNFPIYDESYREALELNIVRHFYTREICCETVGRWKMFLRDRMNIIMPRYNIMYKELEDIADKLFYTVDIKESRDLEGTANSNSSSNSNTDSTNTSSSNSKANSSGSGSGSNNSASKGNGTTDAWQTSNDTPQGGLSGLESNKYLSSATHNKGASTQDTSTESNSTTNQESNSTSEASDSSNSKSSNTSNAEATSTSTESYVKKTIGKRGGSEYLTIYNKLVESYLNIDDMIIHELDDLFFQLW